MIYIKKSIAADSRTAPDNTTKEELLASSVQHIDDVRKAMQFFADMLIQAGAKHDHTKIEYIDEFLPRFLSETEG